MNHQVPHALSAIAILAALALSGCGGDSTPDTTAQLQAKVQNVVVIYAENRTFDNLFGNFPGANGLSTVQDADGTTTAAYVAAEGPRRRHRARDAAADLGRRHGRRHHAGGHPGAERRPAERAVPGRDARSRRAPASTLTHDSTSRATSYHRFFENQMEINGGKNDMFAAWDDAGGLTMGHFDYSDSALYKLAQQYVLADNFFEGAFGGSFLNHQYLVCACAPRVSERRHRRQRTRRSPCSTRTRTASTCRSSTTSSTSPASALDGPPASC